MFINWISPHQRLSFFFTCWIAFKDPFCSWKVKGYISKRNRSSKHLARNVGVSSQGNYSVAGKWSWNWVLHKSFCNYRKTYFEASSLTCLELIVLQRTPIYYLATASMYGEWVEENYKNEETNFKRMIFQITNSDKACCFGFWFNLFHHKILKKSATSQNS